MTLEFFYGTIFAYIIVMEKQICNKIFIGSQPFEFDQYGIINTSFGYIEKLNKKIKVINITERNPKVTCECGNCNFLIKNVNPYDKINSIPAKVYGDVTRFKKVGYKNIKTVTCLEDKKGLPIVRISLTLYKKSLNIRKFILPFTCLKYKSNITVIAKTHKHFEFILHEDRARKPVFRCCNFEQDTDEKAMYLLMFMLSAQRDGEKIWRKFKGRNNLEYVEFK